MYILYRLLYLYIYIICVTDWVDVIDLFRIYIIDRIVHWTCNAPEWAAIYSKIKQIYSINNTSAESDDPDPLFNMLDNYAALLCCAFIHAEIVDSLCFLGTHGEYSLAFKSRKLLVNILLVVAKIFPDRTCSELLTAPSLLELAANISPRVNASNTRAHKASQILTALCDAFR